MNPDCRDFRGRLAALLARAPDPAQLAELGWQEHLLACGACRELLEQEEALEALLASLPDPQLPPELAARVIARLRGQDGQGGQVGRGEQGLDDLLALDEVGVPDGLADSVRAAVRAAVRESGAVHALDRLLELPPEPEVPVGLAARVLVALRAERAPAGPVPSLERARGGRRVLLRSAALLLVSLALASAWRLTRQPMDDPAGGGSGELGFDDEEVIANLPLLELWDVLDELEPLELDLLTRLDLSDEACLDTEDS